MFYLNIVIAKNFYIPGAVFEGMLIFFHLALDCFDFSNVLIKMVTCHFLFITNGVGLLEVLHSVTKLHRLNYH